MWQQLTRTNPTSARSICSSPRCPTVLRGGVFEEDVINERHQSVSLKSGRMMFIFALLDIYARLEKGNE